MLVLPMVLLQHHTPTGTHHDWLLAQPQDPKGLLWAFRCTLPATHWPGTGPLGLERLAPHRRRYLHYQGWLSAQVGADGQTASRGWVRRVDEGWFETLLWSADHMLLRLHWRQTQGLVQLERQSDRYWRLIWRGDHETTLDGD